MKERITFPQLVELVAAKASTTSRMSELFLQELFATITQGLSDGESIRINGLGTFKIKKDKDNRDVIFTPDKSLAETVNAPFAQFMPVELRDEITDEQLAAIDNCITQEEQQKEEPQSTIEPDTTFEPEQEPSIDPLPEQEAQQEDAQIEPVIDTASMSQEPNKPKRGKLWLALASLAAVVAIIALAVSLNKSENNAPKPIAPSDTVAIKATAADSTMSDTISTKAQPTILSDTTASIKKDRNAHHKYHRYSTTKKSKHGKSSKHHTTKKSSKYSSNKTRKHYRYHQRH